MPACRSHLYAISPPLVGGIVESNGRLCSSSGIAVTCCVRRNDGGLRTIPLGSGDISPAQPASACSGHCCCGGPPRTPFPSAPAGPDHTPSNDDPNSMTCSANRENRCDRGVCYEGVSLLFMPFGSGPGQEPIVGRNLCEHDVGRSATLPHGPSTMPTRKPECPVTRDHLPCSRRPSPPAPAPG